MSKFLKEDFDNFLIYSYPNVHSDFYFLSQMATVRYMNKVQEVSKSIHFVRIKVFIVKSFGILNNGHFRSLLWSLREDVYQNNFIL